MKPDNDKSSSKKANKSSQTIILPGCTQIFQSNRVTNGKFEKFGLLHAKLFVTLIRKLQEAVKFSMSGGDWRQLNLFTGIMTFDKDSAYLYVAIPLSEITKPNRYPEFFEAAKELRTITVKIKSALGRDYSSYTGLINGVEEPTKIKKKSVLYLQIHREVARLLIEIDKNREGVPVFYTKYLYEVALNGTNKYTWKLYIILSSWKARGFYRCTVDELKEQLNINSNDYPAFSDFKRRVLLPVQKDLEKKSDCWYDCNRPGFEIRKNKKVIALCFAIITPEHEKEISDKAEYIRHLLKTYYKCVDRHLVQLQPIFINFTPATCEAILNKLISLREYFEAVKGADRCVNDIAAYTVKCLQEEFMH
jgi:hypothetical protein